MLIDKYVSDIEQETIKLCLEEFLKTECCEEESFIENMWNSENKVFVYARERER